MPPHFKSAQEKQKQQQQQQQSRQQQKPAANKAPINNDDDDEIDRAEKSRLSRAAFVESLFPEKFGLDTSNNNNVNSTRKGPQRRDRSPNSDDDESGNVGFPRKRNTNMKNGVPTNPHSDNHPTKRKQRRARTNPNVKRIKWDRELVRKIHPIKAIPENQRDQYWFNEMSNTVNQSEMCSMPVGSVCIIEPEAPTKIHIMAWESEEAASAAGRVVLNIGAVRTDADLDPRRALAIASLRPFVSSVKLNVQLPPGAYIFHVQPANERLARSAKESGAKILLMLETQTEENVLM